MFKGLSKSLKNLGDGGELDGDLCCCILEEN